jgi:ABC-2 type transport system permease protein
MKITKANKDLLWQMIKTDFKMQYNNSVLGVAWILLQPFLLFLVFYFIFGFLFTKGDEYFVLRLILGILIAQYFTEGTTRGLTSLLSRSDVLLKANFPRQIAVTASIINSFIAMFFSFIIFFIFWIFKPTAITLLWLLIPLYLIIFTALIIGISFITSILYVRFRDLQKIWPVLMRLVFYGSAVFYPITIIPEEYRYIIFLNPVAVVIHHIGQIIIDNQMPDFKFLFVLIILSAIIFIIGYFYFKKKVKKVAEYF